MFSDEQLLNNPQIYRYYNASSSHHSSIYSAREFVYFLLLAVVQGVCIELVTIYGTQDGDRDFMGHFIFWVLYTLQDCMLLLMIPNITAAYFYDILLMHVLLFVSTFALSCTDVTGSMVPFMSLKWACVGRVRRSYAMSDSQFWFGGIVTLFASLLIYVVIRVFGNYH